MVELAREVLGGSFLGTQGRRARRRVQARQRRHPRLPGAQRGGPDQAAGRRRRRHRPRRASRTPAGSGPSCSTPPPSRRPAPRPTSCCCSPSGASTASSTRRALGDIVRGRHVLDGRNALDPPLAGRRLDLPRAGPPPRLTDRSPAQAAQSGTDSGAAVRRRRARHRARCHARQALATMASTSCRIAQPRSRAASSPEATIRAGSPGRRARDLGRELDPGDPAHGVHDLQHRQPLAAAEVVDRLQRPALLQRVGRGDVREREVLDVDVVAHAGAVGRRVVGAEDLSASGPR